MEIRGFVRIPPGMSVMKSLLYLWIFLGFIALMCIKISLVPDVRAQHCRKERLRSLMIRFVLIFTWYLLVNYRSRNIKIYVKILFQNDCGMQNKSSVINPTC
jgi:hypothetical protein